MSLYQAEYILTHNHASIYTWTNGYLHKDRFIIFSTT